MKRNETDVVVLGAGIVGVCAALHLQRRGRDVVLVDRNGTAGDETSYGNAGLIECASVFPYMFPRDPGHLLRYALNGSADAHYQLSGIPEFLPWLVRYFLASSPRRAAETAQAALPLIRRSLAEHEALIADAGVPELLRKTGWIKLFRSSKSFTKALGDLERARQFGVVADVLDRAGIAAREPNLTGDFAGAIHWLEPGSIPDPGGLVKAYAELFSRRGGRFVQGDARTLQQEEGGWRVATELGIVTAREAVVAMGPWSDLVFKPLGYRFPLGVKRGYHIHLSPRGNASLQHAVLDADRGYLLAPMNRGIRLTTGAEFARRDAPPSPVQIAQTLPVARSLFPLGETIEQKPWMGSRPCFPDMLPLIGRAPRHPGLWFDFGHQHHGLTLGPVTGRLLAEMMTGEQPLTDPRPFSAERFG